MANNAFKVHKSKKLADDHRKRGNELFKRYEFKKALTAYNVSLCTAPTGSKELALAYGNRSAVYCQAEQYAECLENIELARENGFPVDEMSLLDVREEKVKKLMESGAGAEKFNPWSFFKLSYPVNEQIPFIVNCLELREDDKFGRYIITSQELKTGDVIAIEQPFFAYVRGNDRFTHCCFCLKWNKLNLIPCPKCADTMYCSLDCQQKDYAHQLKFCSAKDCNVFASITMSLNSLRIAGSTSELVDLLSNTQSRTVFDFDLSNPHDPAYEKNLLIAANSLQKKAWNEGYDLDGHMLMKLLLSNDKSKPETPKTATEKASLQKCLSNQARIGINFYGLGHCESFKDSARSIGGGLFPFMSLLNHSCDPNVDNIFVDGKMAYVIRRPIKAGEQIFVAYCTDFQKQSRFERQWILKKDYEFVCDCNACVNDYPEVFQSQRKDRRFVPSSPNFSSPQEAIEKYKKNCEYIKSNIKNHPCAEISFLILENDTLLRGLTAPIL